MAGSSPIRAEPSGWAVTVPATSSLHGRTGEWPSLLEDLPHRGVGPVSCPAGSGGGVLGHGALSEPWCEDALGRQMLALLGQLTAACNRRGRTRPGGRWRKSSCSILTGDHPQLSRPRHPARCPCAGRDRRRSHPVRRRPWPESLRRRLTHHPGLGATTTEASRRDPLLIRALLGWPAVRSSTAGRV